MTAGVGVWKGIKLDTYPQVFFCGECETNKRCERERGAAGEMGAEEMRRDVEKGRRGGQMDGQIEGVYGFRFKN